VKQKGGDENRKGKTMRLGEIFRICHPPVAIFLGLLVAHPAKALWLEVTGNSYPVVAPLVINLDALKPPPGDTTHGFFAMPPTSINVADPRLRLQYRADFPTSVTIETSGALTADHVTAAGALSLTTRIVFVERWWAPRLSANLADFNLEGMARGRFETGDSVLRTEWKIKF
jgi:hypothetical protein